MHGITLLGALLIYPSILMMSLPFLGAAIFYGFFVSAALNVYQLIKRK